MLAHDDEQLSKEQLNHFTDLVQRRLNGEPMAYLTGRRSFMDFELHVTPDVLIPRPETELLVEVALQAVLDLDAPQIVDLGTGSGAIAIALALARPDAMVVATDSSLGALAVARTNARQLSARVAFRDGSWFGALEPGQRFDLIVSNPPYIHYQDQHLSKGDLRFEPIGALTDGEDGLSALRIIVLQASQWIRSGGSVWVEHGYDQGRAVRGLFLQAGFASVRTVSDMAGLERVTGGQMV